MSPDDTGAKTPTSKTSFNPRSGYVQDNFGRQLYPQAHWIGRPLLNADTLAEWAKGEGFHDLVPEAWHVTIARPEARSILALDDRPLVIRAKGRRQVSRFSGLLVLEFPSCALTARNRQWSASEAEREFRRFRPHVSFTPDDGRDLSCVCPFRGELVLGSETFDEGAPF